MRILFSTTAGAGHFGPLIPFATALRDRGHEVSVIAPAQFGPTVVDAGFSYLDAPDIPAWALGAVFQSMQAMSFEEANAHYIREVFGRLALQARLADVRRTVERWQPELIVREALEITSFVAGETMGVPQAEVAIGLASLDDVLHPILAEVLAEVGVPEGGGKLRALPRLSFVPPSLDVDSADGRSQARFRWQDSNGPAASLPIWGEPNAPLVYVTFGSEAGGQDLFPGFYRGVLDQLAPLPVRVFLTVGRAADPARLEPIPANTHVERWWPQEHVLPLASAVVAHGGFGTTLSTLWAGKPMVTIPLFSVDQHLNSRRIGDVGVGVSIPAGPAGVQDLGGALISVLGEGSYAEAAMRLSDEIQSLPPPSESVGFFEALAGR